MKKLQLCALGVSMLYLPQGFADITFNGFASVRASQINSDNGTPPYPEFSKEGEISFKDESLFALQARADLGEGLSATVQLYSEGASDFDVEARWAYISYQLDDSHQLSIGKFANPMFHQSEYEKVGYAHNFARLPKAVYIGFDFATVEGIKVASDFELGENTLSTQLLYGNWDGEIYLASVNSEMPFGLDDILSINLTYAGEWWKVYTGGFTSTIQAETIDNTVLLAFAQPGIAISGASNTEINQFFNNMRWHDKDGNYMYAGFGIDYNNWLIDFEYTYYGIDDSVDGFNSTWYLALGRRFDNNITVTIHTEEYEQAIADGFLNGVSNPVLNATGAGIATALSEREFDAVGLNIRYDFHSSAAFKFDIISGEDTRSSVGDYTIFSAGVDIVF
jgi:hypothetical protein